MTTDEYQAHFSLWCLIKSPLLVGCDVTKMSAATKTILMNEEIIALSQDDLGVQGHKLYKSAQGQEVWGGPLANGDVAVILFNRQNMTANITLDFSAHLGLNAQTSVAIRDLVTHADLGSFSSTYSVALAMHASQTLRLTISSAASASRKGKLHAAMTAAMVGGGGSRRYESINQLYDEHPAAASVFGGRRL